MKQTQAEHFLGSKPHWAVHWVVVLEQIEERGVVVEEGPLEEGFPGEEETLVEVPLEEPHIVVVLEEIVVVGRTPGEEAAAHKMGWGWT